MTRVGRGVDAALVALGDHRLAALFRRRDVVVQRQVDRLPWQRRSEFWPRFDQTVAREFGHTTEETANREGVAVDTKAIGLMDQGQFDKEADEVVERMERLAARIADELLEREPASARAEDTAELTSPMS